jgi:hypothetical protein
MCSLQEKDNPEFSPRPRGWYRLASPAAWRQFFDIRHVLNASLADVEMASHRHDCGQTTGAVGIRDLSSLGIIEGQKTSVARNVRFDVLRWR